ncbi:MAG: beta-Ala-His dipeptidase [Clostridia bacterium]|nr:beta-Ala-His dipeptidase [Clostridia bacterium]
MNYLINDMEPLAPFRFFEEISAIPRPPLGEQRIADYLEEFAKARGLACYRDAAHNVLIRKPAAAGRENEPTVLLQAHTDMVAEKRPDVAHDFETDGLTLVREGDRLFADGTTLGADDGFGVAVMLAVLDDGTLSHPALECLFTAAEEIGLVGASRFDYSCLKARYMLNLDSAEEDAVIVGCCGGLRSELTVPVRFAQANAMGITLTVGGLCGGHSGEDIHRGRLNANVLMGELLTALRAHTPFRIASLTGGDKSNAIPRDCTVTLVPDSMAVAELFLAEVEGLARAKITAAEDAGLFICTDTAPVSAMLSYADTDKLMAVLSLPNGILHMRREAPVMPEASRNLASCRTLADKVVFVLSSRSAKESRLAESRAEQDALAAALAGSVKYFGIYPGWESAMDAKLVRAWQEAYRTVTGRETVPTLIHAGLETGLITNAVEGLEAIAVGCNIHDLHTPHEMMELDSFARIYRTVLLFLQNLH